MSCTENTAYLQAHVVLQLYGHARVVLPVLGKIVKLVGVGEHQHQHLVGDDRQPEAVEEASPRAVRDLQGGILCEETLARSLMEALLLRE